MEKDAGFDGIAEDVNEQTPNMQVQEDLSQNNGIVQEFAVILFEGKFWFKFIGIVLIIFGALYCLSIVGAIVGIPMIMVAMSLFTAINKAQEAMHTGSVQVFSESLKAIRRGLKITGIYFLVSVILVLLIFAFYAAILIFIGQNAELFNHYYQ